MLHCSIVYERKPSIYDFLQGYTRSYKDIETLMLQSFFYRLAIPLAGKKLKFNKIEG